MNVVTKAVGLAAMRERRGLTRGQLAQSLGFAEHQIADLESGQISARGPLRRILMRYFNCQFADLFEVVMVNVEEDAYTGQRGS